MGKNHRKSIRLKEYDYSSEGEYFITVVTHNRENLFGAISDGTMVLNDFGEIVRFTWHDLVNHNGNIELDEFVIMPNHVHGIVAIVGAGSKPGPADDSFRAGRGPAPTMNDIDQKVELSEIVRQFKAFSAKRINKLRGISGIEVWQRGYYDHIIRSEKDYEAICNYIVENPQNWENDEESKLL